MKIYINSNGRVGYHPTGLLSADHRAVLVLLVTGDEVKVLKDKRTDAELEFVGQAHRLKGAIVCGMGEDDHLGCDDCQPPTRDQNFEHWRNQYRDRDGVNRNGDGDGVGFRDLLFNQQIQSQTIVATAPDAVPRFVVSLERSGNSGLGEEMGKVTLYRHDELINGDELAEELARKMKTSEAYKDVVFQYSAPLDKAQGYAQGILDGLQVALGLAGRSSGT
jgi:hypothetical protein